MRELNSLVARDIVLANAAAGFRVTGMAHGWDSGLRLANESLDSGRALAVLHRLRAFSVS